MDAINDAIKQIVEKELSCAAHSMDHVMRVYNLCLHLAKYEENVDMEVLLPAALLHDIARVKEDTDQSRSIDHALLGADMAEEILESMDFLREKIDDVKACIVSHRFRNDNEPVSIEAKILFDADKIDVLGAVGIARTYMLAGQYRQLLYTDVPVVEYVKGNIKESGRIKEISKHAPNIEYEMKFKKIPDMLYTSKAREIAKERLKYMEGYFKRLEEEVKGEE